ncbi:SURF1 family protein [Rhizobium sp. 9140]|uniref:SURF1 family protein n=1 Tax=Rhizobium sp. 9140 TaxID=1761900 RepID=UPI0007920057|nr:SURF1 family protein [Rhizobium sp. 9140]CZT36315.1 surfeit locus 1 family protein [Rhizobium sp. 9140]
MSPDTSRRPDTAAGSPEKAASSASGNRSEARAADGDAAAARGSRRGLAVLGAVATVVTVVLLALGIWQVQRLFWKLDLIERVDARVHAAPVEAPRADQWSSITPGNDEYRHISVSGTFRHDAETLVQATTERGPGFWVVTPLVRDDGTTVLVNRGFVPPDRRDPSSRSAGNVPGSTRIVGLLRLSEPGGGFLRENDPSGDRWYSRDVAAIATARGLDHAAPYFIDADGTENPGGLPIGGLTRVVFPNNHLVYALTWFALAAMLIGAMVVIGRREWSRAG